MSHDKTKKHSEKFKHSSVKLALYANQSVSKTAKGLGIKKNILYSWVSKYRHLFEGSKSSQVSQQSCLWDNTNKIYPSDKTVPQLFEKQVQNTPAALSIIYKHQFLTYAELNKKANQLARYLIDCGVKTNKIIAVVLPPSIERVITMIAILKTGNAYLPIDLNSPNKRIKYILSDSNASIIISIVDATEKIYVQNQSSIIFIDKDSDAINSLDDANLDIYFSSAQMAYVIYTSGSTGNPKGTCIPHYGINRLVINTNFIQITTKDCLSQISNIAFDVSTFEIWGALLNGAKLVIIDEETTLNPLKLKHVIDNDRINIVFLPTQLFNTLCITQISCLYNLDYLLVAGEAANSKLFGKMLKEKYKPKFLINAYGPTENTTFSTYYVCNKVAERAKSIPIGMPISNTQCYILNNDLELVDQGQVGDLFLGGDGLALGYLNQPDKTKDSFIVNPLTGDSSDLIYKTGDLVRQLPDGNIDYIGRKDNQVKIRGFRVELEEINITLLGHKHIQQALVSLKKYNNNKEIVAYITVIDSYDISATDLQNYLAVHLPEYMIPTIYIVLDKFPMTGNGKIDNRKLPPPNRKNTLLHELDYIPAETEIEKKVVATLCDLMDMQAQQVSIDTDLFLIGFNSLLAIRLVSILNINFYSQLDMKDIFPNRTVKKISALIEQSVGTFKYGNYLIGLSNLSNTHDTFPLTNMQGAYILGRSKSFEISNNSINEYKELLFDTLDIDNLERSLNILINRHPALRTVFNEESQQILLVEQDYQIANNGLVNLVQLEGIRKRLACKLYDISSLPLFDFEISQLDDNFILHINMDALLLDGVSYNIFMTELAMLYSSTDSAAVKLPALEINFQDYIKQYKKIRSSILFKESKKYWLNKIDAYDLGIGLPMIADPVTVTNPVLKTLTTIIPKKTWENLKDKAQQHQLSLTSVILFAYGLVLTSWSGQLSFCINMTLFNRLPLHKQINDILGNFTTTELFNSKRSQAHSILYAITSTHRELWNDLEHNLFDGIDCIRLIRQKFNLAPNKAIAPVVLTSMLGEENKYLSLFGCKNSSYTVSDTAQIYLENYVYENTEGLAIQWSYVPQLFDKTVINNMHKDYCYIIECLAETNWESDVPSLKLPYSDIAIIEKANSAFQTKVVNNLVDSFFNHDDENIAVIDVNSKYTYKKIKQYSYRIANYLYSKKHVENMPIAILSEKGYQQVIASIGIMKSGNTYLPLHHTWPISRINTVLTEGNVKYILVSDVQYEKIIQGSKIEHNYSWLIIESIASDESITTEEKVLPDINANSTAYIIFTSGSTGIPKGVAISHQSAANTIIAVNNKFSVNINDKILALSELSFDLSVYDIFGTLFAGGTIVFPDPCQDKDPDYWCSLIKKHGITIWNSVPQMMQLLAEAYDGKSDSLRLILMSGDWIPLNLPEQIRKFAPNAVIMSLGGATEGSIWSIWHEIKEADVSQPYIPYGIAMPNQKIHILDETGEYCRVNVLGEIHIGGDGVALEYWNNAEETKNSFINHHKLGRLYKTGDIGKWSERGYVKFEGRKDNQIKLNGYRIELNEITFTLNKLENIDNSIAMIQNNNIIAYIVSDKLENKNSIYLYLEKYLKKHLPEYMLPKHYMVLSELPLTQQGKIDFNALPKIKICVNSHSVPKGDTEHMLSKIYVEVLELDTYDFDVTQSFFNLGGNSMSVLRLKNKLNKIGLFKKLTIPDLFTYDSIAKLSNWNHGGQNKKLNSTVHNNCPNSLETNNHEIAIIGMSGAFSGASDIQDLWEMISNQREGISENMEITGPKSKNFIPFVGHIDDISLFDPNFWGLSVNEAKLLDPQIRKFLEHSWLVLEKSGYIKQRESLKIGVFAGSGDTSYFYKNVLDGEESEYINFLAASTSNGKDALTMKVAFLLGLTGPAISINTTCSTSLVTVIDACQKINLGMCDIAIAGGVSLAMPEQTGYFYEEGMIFSKDGHCRTFDKKASGTVRGSGVGVILLKHLENAKRDNDNILGVIKGYAINNDGSRKTSYLAPSVAGQRECIVTAQRMAKVSSNEVDYVECHGTATNIGDAIELQALQEAFVQNNKQQPLDSTKTSVIDNKCTLGSIKANIGHVDSAAGVASIIKICSMFKHGIVTGQANFEEPNPELNLDSTNFEINPENKPWATTREHRLAGVSAFGFGGTNAHIIISDYTSNTENIKNLNSYAHDKEDKEFIFPLSAKTITSLHNYKDALLKYLYKNEINQDKLANISYTLQQRKDHFAYRMALYANSYKDLMNNLKENKPIIKTNVKQNKKIIFVFPGQGIQYQNMAYDLYCNEPTFKETVDHCINIASEIIDQDFGKIIYPHIFASEHKFDINETIWTQPALFIIEYALARYLEEMGIYADFYIGHSIGEFVAATLAGVFKLEDAIKVVIARGECMQEMSRGSMLLMQKSHRELAEVANIFNCDIASINSPNDTVLSGTESDIKALYVWSNKNNISATILATSHAYHSRMMEKASIKLYTALKDVEFAKPEKPFISNLTGEWSDRRTLTPQYWCDQLKHKVELSKGIRNCLNHKGISIFIECGPGRGLGYFITKCGNIYNKEVQTIQLIPSKKEIEEKGYKDINIKENIISKLWSFGLLNNFKNIKFTKTVCVTDLPTYQFDSQPYWIMADKTNNTIYPVTVEKELTTFINKKKIIIIEKNYTDVDYKIAQLLNNLLGIKEISLNDEFYNIGGSSIFAVELTTKINKTFNSSISVADIIREKTIAGISRLLALSNNGINIINQFQRKLNKKLDNMIFIHPAHAGEEVYQRIANELQNKYNCIGIGNYNIQSSQKIFSLSKLALLYIKEYEEIYNFDENIYLFGWSQGGKIALEMAYILENRGYDNINIILLDSCLPDSVLLTLFKEEYNAEVKENFRKELAELYDEEYVKKVISAWDSEAEIANCYLSGILIKTNVILFKANQIDGKTPIKLNKYLLTLDNSNIETQVKNIKTIDVDCHHFNILEHSTVREWFR
ncbi:non-ribosomal peptide synthetase/type I polyketide synthase [Shewanella surugensis]|uniref:Amino acid adenylation domain-containing protein n=1 Tax=Shewanella surugensis TaxID=212020 RepID=A0ABT0LID1_9GAMM|nr:non-ribosomal peptide synthetase/type I polyketide synthase [Shewanella surugensis]MCL1127458.1 amino acid adenylation domain-containing protein [Shewanella surugensis]